VTIQVATEFRVGMQYLKGEALRAHASGDGFAVNHVCSVAIDAMTKALNSPKAKTQEHVSLQEVRWVFAFWLYWLVDYELWTGASGSLAVQSLIDELDSESAGYDHRILSWLCSAIAQPLAQADVDQLLSPPDAWLCERSIDVPDVLVLCLAIELVWHSNPGGDDWKRLIHSWLGKAPAGSRLLSNLNSLHDRLSAQTFLCGSSAKGGSDSAPTTSPLSLCWHAFLECDWSKLDDLLRKLSVSTQVDSTAYIPLFNLVHMSRPFRRGGDNQMLSLSRRLFSLSRQPSEVFANYRARGFDRYILHLCRKSDFSDGVHDRWRCFVLARLSELSALRSWDYGKWREAIGQQFYAHLEIAQFGNALHAMHAVKNAVLALRAVEKKGKDTKFDGAVALLDKLAPEDRSTLIRWLLERRPIEWWAADSVFGILTDSVPDELLPDLARWSVNLARTEKKMHGWSISYLSYWREILPYAAGARRLVELLRPALLHELQRPGAWRLMHETLDAALVGGELDTAIEIGSALISVEPTPESDDDSLRWSVLFSACRQRRELFGVFREWLVSQSSHSPLSQHLIARLTDGRSFNTPVNDANVRDWLRDEITKYCKSARPVGGTRQISGLAFSASSIRLVTWPDNEDRLLNVLLETIDSPEVMTFSKGPLLEVLAHLSERLRKKDATLIVNSALQWLNDGISGVALPWQKPSSLDQVTSTDSESAKSGLFFLSYAVLRRFPARVSKRLANWLLRDGLRQSPNNADRVFLMMAYLGLNSSGSIDGFVAMSEAVVSQSDDPASCILSFRYLLAPGDGSKSIILIATDSAARILLLSLWEARLIQLVGDVRAKVRLAVALTISIWREQKNSIGFSPALRNARETLLSDCRASVRQAAQ
jgi:hypothetical protein